MLAVGCDVSPSILGPSMLWLVQVKVDEENAGMASYM
jgi:hypothetical protein